MEYTLISSVSKSEKHPHSQAREWALKFLYQCEIEKLFHFPASHLNRFLVNFELSGPVVVYMQHLIQGVFREYQHINQMISQHSKNWSLERMPTTDRCILRLAVFELMEKQNPRKVVINEAIELAKTYGTKDSGAFVNGILDRIEV